MGRQGPLDILDFPLQLARSPEVGGNVGTNLLVELDEVVNDIVVEVLTAGSQDLEDAAIYGGKGNTKGSTTEIADDNPRTVTLLLRTVGDGGSGMLVDDTKGLKIGNGAGGQ